MGKVKRTEHMIDCMNTPVHEGDLVLCSSHYIGLEFGMIRWFSDYGFCLAIVAYPENSWRPYQTGEVRVNTLLARLKEGKKIYAESRHSPEGWAPAGMQGRILKIDCETIDLPENLYEELKAELGLQQKNDDIAVSL